jgi:hypothetical protein
VLSPKYEDSPQMCILITDKLKTLLCLGRIGSQSRFCVAPKDAGYSHCGIKSHGAKNSGTSKFPAEVDHYYPPAGLSHGKPTARTDPCIHKDSIPRHMVAVFREGVFSSRKWSHMIIDAAAFVPARGDDEGDENYLGSEGEEEIHEASYSEDDMELDDEGDLEVEFNWQDDISNLGTGTDWGPPARLHRVALDLL